MAKQYTITSGTRRINKLMGWMSRRGVGRTAESRTTGRTSGQSRTVPVSPWEMDGSTYLVSPYGEVNWVHNVRANGEVTISKGRDHQSHTLTEVTGQVGPVVAAYYEREGFARPFMDVPENPSLHDFEAAASQFPVFLVT